jgi:hypothetical protein
MKKIIIPLMTLKLSNQDEFDYFNEKLSLSLSTHARTHTHTHNGDLSSAQMCDIKFYFKAMMMYTNGGSLNKTGNNL